ncbi:MAG TPA: thiol-disulfide oxidoreductase DCC family protein [Flavisolibacter sp.]|nr:thiol-disulfide oxidoreductase DCC family protein [Flavisolibacter sp.]
MKPTSQPIILFDGVCNFCNGSVNFLIRQDKKKHLRFAALQSAIGQNLLEVFHLSTKEFNSFVLIDQGKIYTASSAGLRVYHYLPWYWQWTQLFRIVPKFLRDGIYYWIARNRYKWFGKKDQCMVPDRDVRSRFL